jgi:hypothetical protein
MLVLQYTIVDNNPSPGNNTLNQLLIQNYQNPDPCFE